ncbi:unnamed protein product [Dibothriocephalus latus]|uniref:Uncharacterized protein n=1 Tax=Dibothriocephalus latus TaxID=60516 RepID=A0A3P7N999_DIBLA|nr:unnamed protein product [Dibothriocephalus latus]
MRSSNTDSFFIQGSRRSSSSESSGESELLLRSELREQEHRALIELELCKVRIFLRSNCSSPLSWIEAGILNGW